jgi:hypothetical protein
MSDSKKRTTNGVGETNGKSISPAVLQSEGNVFVIQPDTWESSSLLWERAWRIAASSTAINGADTPKMAAQALDRATVESRFSVNEMFRKCKY